MAFSLFDADADGAINALELKKVMKTLGLENDDQLLRKMINKFDLDGEDDWLVGCFVGWLLFWLTG